MPEIIFRQPTIDDAQAIVDFYNIVGGETTFLSFEQDEYPLNVEDQVQSIKAVAEQKNSVMILAFENDEIVGIGTINSSNKIKSRHSGELGIVVKKMYHGKGIGSQIIQQLIEWAKSNGITTRIQLDTRCDNIGAVELYKKFGFEIEGCLKNSTLLNGEYYDLYVMGLLLDK
ncbi:GNAT family N-acetyltransferase [Bacillus massiliigorillae]|uniref:GNAT family N-acetyltransferase n=1 Tax=Bacillus massiliigorillae TaxID=1243664 RepID=UPI0003A2662D|nr:GNAT family protein [Bacillus massiliigorillae]